MKHLPIEPKKTGVYVTDIQTSVDVGDVIKVEHSDGVFFAEITAIETGDAGEALFFQYINPKPEFEASPVFLIKRPFSD